MLYGRDSSTGARSPPGPSGIVYRLNVSSFWESIYAVDVWDVGMQDFCIRDAGRRKPEYATGGKSCLVQGAAGSQIPDCRYRDTFYEDMCFCFLRSAV